MALLAQRKDRLYQFIVSRFSEYDYERVQSEKTDDFEEFAAEPYETFMAYQRQNVDALNADTLTVLEYLLQLLPNIDILDKEVMVSGSADGLIFLNGKMIFTSPR